MCALPDSLVTPLFKSRTLLGGSGGVQVVGVDGEKVLETTVKGGTLFIVPRFYVISKIAELGMVLYHHYSKVSSEF